MMERSNVEEAERNTYKNQLQLNNTEQPIISFIIPDDAAGKEIHLIVEVSDQNPIASLSDYRRIVINVTR